ncbi:MAG: CRTAC1 family protein [Planctomycetota bacterium]
MSNRLVFGVLAGAVSFGASGQRCDGSLLFTEVAQSIGIDFEHDGLGIGPAIYYMSSGGVAGDFNNDGWPDLFVLATGSRADALYINQGDGTFVDEAAAWGLDRTHFGVGAAAADFNGDGWLDIYVTSHSEDGGGERSIGQHRLYRNNGDGTFTDVAASAGVSTTATTQSDGWGASFGDYDLDGDLDLAVAGWFDSSGGNKLFRNNGDETFTDVTAAAGIESDLAGVFGFSPRFADMDGDRYPELIWTADFGTSLYFVNDGDGTFTEATAAAGVGLESNGMGVTVADFNGDGLLDWYATSIDQEHDQDPRADGAGNMLYLNAGNHTFAEVSDGAGVSEGWWGWGTVGVDFDHDGDVDIAETNGWFHTPWTERPACLWLNDGSGMAFTEFARPTQFEHESDGRGLLNFDYDMDGDQDIVVFSRSDRLRVFQNDLSGTCTGWLRVELDTSLAANLAPHGVGATVRVIVGANEQVAQVHAGTNFIAQSELTAHFGLGEATVADRVEVEWPNGTVTILNNVAIDRSIVISACPADANGDGAVAPDDFNAWVVAFNGAMRACDQNGDGACLPDDFNAWVAGYNAGCPGVVVR